MNPHPEQYIIERIHAIELAATELKQRMEAVDEHILELHKDVRNLLSFKANILGLAVGSSGAVSLLISLVIAWWKH